MVVNPDATIPRKICEPNLIGIKLKNIERFLLALPANIC